MHPGYICRKERPLLPQEPTIQVSSESAATPVAVPRVMLTHISPFVRRPDAPWGSPQSIADIRWETLETRRAIIRYQSQDDLRRFNKKIKYRVEGASLLALFSPSDSRELADLVTKKVDALFERAQEMFENVNDSNGVIFYHRGLGDILLATGKEDQAYSQFAESLAHSRRANFRWGAVYALAGMSRSAVALKNFESAQKHLSEGLQSVSITGDIGLALVVLAGCAKLYADRGENELAIELCSLVVEQFATWRETKNQVMTLLEGLKALPPEDLIEVQLPGRQNEVWDMANRLLEVDFSPVELQKRRTEK